MLKLSKGHSIYKRLAVISFFYDHLMVNYITHISSVTIDLAAAVQLSKAHSVFDKSFFW